MRTEQNSKPDLQRKFESADTDIEQANLAEDLLKEFHRVGQQGPFQESAYRHGLVNEEFHQRVGVLMVLGLSRSIINGVIAGVSAPDGIELHDGRLLKLEDDSRLGV